MQTDFVPEHLPAWMRQPRRNIDWGVLLAAALGLISAWAFLFRPGIPAYTGLLQNGFMAADLADALREGRLLAQWSPHVLSGYGAPVPSFLPQGGPLMVALAAQLLTGDASSGLRLVLAAALSGSAVAQYLFCRRWIGPPAALLSAGLYVFSPVLGLTAPHIVGDLPGVVGMALLPMALWAASRSADHSSRWDVPLAAAVFSVLLLTHPPMAGSAAAIAAVLTAAFRRSALLRLALALAAAVGMTAPFWLPAVQAADQVRWTTPVAPLRLSITAESMIAAVRPVDPVVLNPAPQYTIGPLLAVFAVGGLGYSLTAGRRRKFATAMTLGVVVSAAGAVLTNTPWPVYILTLCCAGLGGIALEWRIRLPQGLRRAALPAALIVLLVGSSAVWLSPFGPSADDVSPLAQIEFELNGFGSAVLPENQPMPVTIRDGLPAERSLIESYRSPPLIRIRPGSPARVTPISSTGHGSTWQVSTTAASTITLSLAYFPGWRADLNGEPLVVTRDPATGLVSVALPQTTNGTLRVSLGPVPGSEIAWLLVLVASAMLVLWTRLGPRGQPVPARQLNVQEMRLTGFAVAFAGLALVAVAVPGGALNVRSEPFSSLRSTQPLAANAEPLRLLGYQFEETRLHAGDLLRLTLFWTSDDVPDINVGVRLILTDIDRQSRYVLTQSTAPGGVPTRRWLAGYVVRDHYAIVMPDEIVAGTYQIMVEAFPCDVGCATGQPIQFTDGQGVARPSIRLPTVVTVGG